ncbi:MAG: SDR family oxidoreductase [Parcubacteria group bacterium]|nr:SDR family oxidoreductase [Parcubacteria group bacterium]
MFNLQGKVALITGAQRGMGAVHSKILARQGAKVVVTDINEETCIPIVDEIKKAGGEAACFKLDVTKEEEIDAVITETVRVFGRLDILVNNAGIYQPKPFLELTKDDWERMLRINLEGQFLCAKRAAQEMMKNKWGRIINIASIASGGVGIGIQGGTHYTASKGGSIGFTEALAVELAPHGILVNAIAPGAIRTPMIDEAGMSEADVKGMLQGVPLRRIGEPEEVSAAVVFLASDEASYVTGSTVYVDGGWLAA